MEARQGTVSQRPKTGADRDCLNGGQMGIGQGQVAADKFFDT